MRNSPRLRRTRGQAVIGLMSFLTIFFVLVLGMTAFEMVRYSLCCQEFQHCVDAAALAGSAGLASSNNTNQAQSQQIAIQIAQWIFEQNSILAVQLKNNGTYAVSNAAPPTPPAFRANLNFRWLDPQTGQPTADPAAQKIMQIQGAYGYKPLVGDWIGLPSNSVLRCSVTSNGAGPMLDIVLCLDLSGSIDDSTMTSFVQRYYVPGENGGLNRYSQVTINGTGTLYQVVGATNPLGTAVNACYPQTLDAAGNPGMGALVFDSARRGSPTQGSRPGVAGINPDVRAFTDVVVNLDEKPVFAGYTYNGYDFPTLGSLVEAARGNLESNEIAKAAGVDLDYIGVSAPRAGYYQAYWQAALQHRHPLHDAQTSSATFFQILNNSVDAHFGLVGFSTQENTTLQDNAVANASPQVFPMQTPVGPIPTSSKVAAPIPFVALNPAAGPAFSNFDGIMQYMPPNNPPNPPQLTAYGNTDINGALTRALQMLVPNSRIAGGQKLARKGSTKAIVLFTDGLPNTNTGLGDMNGAWISQQAGQNGVKIYCIGLAQIASLQSQQNAVLQPIATNSGGKYYQIPPGTNQAAALNRAFGDIARSLVGLVR
ncbi:MAG TPA: vWA domain-containing protein [Candidatus Obscuribacterales bacterium]